jgi:hypothetical protein
VYTYVSKITLSGKKFGTQLIMAMIKNSLKIVEVCNASTIKCFDHVNLFPYHCDIVSPQVVGTENGPQIQWVAANILNRLTEQPP